MGTAVQQPKVYDLLGKLEQLKVWQEEQQQRLKLLQTFQWQQFHEEEAKAMDSSQNLQLSLSNENLVHLDPLSPASELSLSNSPVEKKEKPAVHFNPNDEIITVKNFSEPSFQYDSMPQMPSKPKFKFLKRGEGIARFSGKIQRPQKNVNRMKSNNERPGKIDDSFQKPRKLIRKLQLQPAGSSPKHLISQNSGIVITPSVSPISKKSDAVTDFPLIANNCSSPIVFDDEEFPCAFQKDENDAEDDEIKNMKSVDKENLAEFETLEKAAYNCSLTSDCSLLKHVDPRDKPSLEDINNNENISNITFDTSVDDDFDSDKMQTDEPKFQLTKAKLESLLLQMKDQKEGLKYQVGDNQVELLCSGMRVMETLNHINIPGKIKKDMRHAPIPLPKKKSSITKKGNSDKQANDVADKILNKHLAEFIEVLETEMKKVKEGSKYLNNLGKKKQIEMENLKQKRESYEQQKTELARQMEELESEKGKFLRAKKSFENYQKTTKEQLTKQEKSEMTDQKKQVEAMKEELRRQETKWLAEFGRHRTRLTSTEKERDSLKADLQRTESQRLELLTKFKEAKLQIKLLQAKQLKSNKEVEILNSEDILVEDSLPTIQVHSENRKLAATEQKEIIPGNCFYKPNEIEPVTEAKKAAPVKLSEKPKVHFNLEESFNETAENETIDEGENKTHWVEKICANGDRAIIFPNGTRKIIDCSTQMITINYYNGDVKQQFPDNKEVYHFSDSGTMQTTLPDGTINLQFENGQEEKHTPDGTVHIKFTDGSSRSTYKDGTEEIQAVDGTSIKKNYDGTEVIRFPSGQKEVRSKEFCRREYPDGTTKTVYVSGWQETWYPTGRLRIKDSEGRIVVDRKAVP